MCRLRLSNFVNVFPHVAPSPVSQRQTLRSGALRMGTSLGLEALMILAPFLRGETEGRRAEVVIPSRAEGPNVRSVPAWSTMI